MRKLKLRLTDLPNFSLEACSKAWASWVPAHDQNYTPPPFASVTKTWSFRGLPTLTVSFTALPSGVWHFLFIWKWIKPQPLVSPVYCIRIREALIHLYTADTRKGLKVEVNIRGTHADAEASV